MVEAARRKLNGAVETFGRIGKRAFWSHLNLRVNDGADFPKVERLDPVDREHVVVAVPFTECLRSLPTSLPTLKSSTSLR